MIQLAKANTDQTKSVCMSKKRNKLALFKIFIKNYTGMSENVETVGEISVF